MGPQRDLEAVVIMAQGADDVLAAVRFARDEGMGVGVMATGHGVGALADGGLLVNTSRMRGVCIDRPRSPDVGGRSQTRFSG